MRATRWTPPILIGWGLLFVWSALQLMLPASWWFDAGQVRVLDTVLSEPCAGMEFDRDINREFSASWTVTIMRQNPMGGFATYATFLGANDYRPGNELPDDMNLCWWTWTDTLNLSVGTYRVHTLWKLHVDGGVREVRRTSNAFEVKPAS